MTFAYDRIQIIVDDDWGLVGIVPLDEAGDKFKGVINQLEEIPLVKGHELKDQEPQDHELKDQESKAQESKAQESKDRPTAASLEHPSPEAKMINPLRRPIIRDAPATLMTPVNSQDRPSEFGAINRLSTSRSRNRLVGFGK